MPSPSSAGIRRPITPNAITCAGRDRPANERRRVRPDANGVRIAAIREGRLSASGRADRSSGFRQRLAPNLADEGLECLRLGPTDFLYAVGHRKARPFRIEAGAAQRFPQRGKMTYRVLIIASRKRVAAPLLVADLFVAHVLAE